jgi:hypothetical protein
VFLHVPPPSLRSSVSLHHPPCSCAPICTLHNYFSLPLHCRSRVLLCQCQQQWQQQRVSGTECYGTGICPYLVLQPFSLPQTTTTAHDGSELPMHVCLYLYHKLLLTLKPPLNAIATHFTALQPQEQGWDFSAEGKPVGTPDNKQTWQKHKDWAGMLNPAGTRRMAHDDSECLLLFIILQLCGTNGEASNPMCLSRNLVSTHGDIY